jgi:hypothetical protein
MAEDGRAPSQPLLGLTAGEVRRAVDGWHAVLRIGSADRRIRSKDTPVLGTSYTAELRLRRFRRACVCRPPAVARNEMDARRGLHFINYLNSGANA